MDILIKNALIYDHSGQLDGERKDILISKGIIQSIAKNISSTDVKIIESHNLHCSIGWCDLGTHLGEPGYEYRETTSSLSEAATAGGYTALITFPGTKPIVQSASDIKYLKSLFASKVQDIYPVAAISKDMKGQDLTEMKDLIAHGAVGFSDGLKGIQSAGLLMRALQYTSDHHAPIIDHPVDRSLTEGAQIHEGEVSIMMGLKGIPSISEGIQVQRNIALAKYAHARLIIHALSSKKALHYIEQAQKKGTDIRVTVSYLNLIANHHDLDGFNVQYKVEPPLRTPSGQRSLWNGVKRGSIQAIVSNHIPLEVEKKMLEFPYAEFGAIGLETCFAALSTMFNSNLNPIINALTVGPRQLMNIDLPEIKKGVKANLTLFDPDEEWTYNQPKSLSSNSPFINQKFKGKVIGVVKGSKCILNK